jgi:hypothetical protein
MADAVGSILPRARSSLVVIASSTAAPQAASKLFNRFVFDFDLPREHAHVLAPLREIQTQDFAASPVQVIG